MSSAINSGKLLERLTCLLSDNKRDIFEDSENGFRIVRFSVSKPLHRREDRYHQILDVTYGTNNGLKRKRVWLKYRDDFEALYKIHRTVYEQIQIDQPFLPKPYFYGKWDDVSVIGMEFVKGVSLRNLVLRKLVFGGSKPLEEIFRKIGNGMRLFHDSSARSGAQRVSELAANAHKVTAATEYLTDEERKEIIMHVKIAEKNANPQTELPLIKIHNDWVLRNILVGDEGSFHIVDLDSMRAPNNSRWYDVGYFLINLESQLKYGPIIRKKSITKLWRSFWRGYSQGNSPDALSPRQITSLIYLIKVQYMFGATIRPALFKIYSNLFGPRYMRDLKRSIVQGEYSTLAFNLRSN